MVVPDSDPGRILVSSDETDICPVLPNTLAVVMYGRELATEDLATNVGAVVHCQN